MTTDIHVLAQRERAAEQNKKAAEVAWRAAWWDLTLALAEVPKSEAGSTLAATAEELGQSVDRMHKRRQVGARVMAELIDNREIHRVPPSTAITYVSVAGKDAVLDTATAARLVQAEADGESVRDLADQFVVEAGKPDRVVFEGRASAEDVREAIAKDPTIVARAITEQPEVAEHIAADPEASRIVHTARDKVVRDKVDGMDVPKASVPDEPTDRAWLETRDSLTRAQMALRESYDQLGKVPTLTEAQREHVLAEVGRAQTWIDGLTQLVNGKKDIDTELMALLKEES